MALGQNCNTVYWSKIYGCAFARSIAEQCQNHKHPFIVLTSNITEARQLVEEIRFFMKENDDFKVYLLPDWETLAYDEFSPSPQTSAMRIQVLSKLAVGESGVYVCPFSVLFLTTCPPSFLLQNHFVLQRGDKIDVQKFTRELVKNGYSKAPQVSVHGEFSVRGSILDFFPPESNDGIRIDLFDDTIEGIRIFDTQTQLSIRTTGEIHFAPAREFPFNEKSITLFRKKFRNMFDSYCGSLIYQHISEGIMAGGVEYYLPLFFEQAGCFFDYLPKGSSIVLPARFDELTKVFWQDANQRFQQRVKLVDYPPIPPSELFLDAQRIDENLQGFSTIVPDFLASVFPRKKSVCHYAGKPPPVAVSADSSLTTKGISQFLENFGGKTLLVATTLSGQEHLIETLEKHCIYPKVLKGWHEFSEIGKGGLAVTVANLSDGALWDRESIAIFTENQILGRAFVPASIRSTRDSKTKIHHLNELEIGKPVVHEEYGIGYFEGLETITMRGADTDFCIIQYADNDKIFVPVYALHLLSRYTGIDGDHIQAHKLNTKRWGKVKRKAAESLWDIAAEIVDTHARRQATSGYAFKTDLQEYAHFCRDFPFEETLDQLTAIQDVLKDMSKPCPMDRIVCGDVGFGKTEIALRAAFIAAFNSKQTMILCPTTILAQQHYETFNQRFSNFPVCIGILSRLQTPEHIKSTQHAIENGLCDIIIGTHKMIHSNLSPPNLGLLIIDEEHRFGVRDKEKLKSLHSKIDLLTLTATPIPRTLHISFCKMRELTVIATPPNNRKAVETFVTEWSDELIQISCERELRRGGLVYFVHNNISELDQLAARLGKLVPRAKIAVAHGAMEKIALEKSMVDFHRLKIQILVCTTIIESGIDNPNTNTIFINNAENFGLSQLHQLRGRVGRSHHTAYAYLLLNQNATMTNQARKRIKAIDSMSELGVGYTIASHDLEIRGAGKLLGKEQSGHVQEVGMYLYNHLLQRAIASIKNGKVANLDAPLSTNCEIYFNSSTLIPSEYVPDVNMRILLYRRIAMAETEAELEQIKGELIDRFGVLHAPAKNLFLTARLRMQCQQYSIIRVEAGTKSLRLQFDDNPKINITRLLTLIKKHPDRYKLTQSNILSITHILQPILPETQHLAPLSVSSRNTANHVQTNHSPPIASPPTQPASFSRQAPPPTKITPIQYAKVIEDFFRALTSI